MHPTRLRPPSARTRPVSARAGAWLAWAQTLCTTALSRHARAARAADDRGATAIEWAVFAALSLTIAAMVAGAITAAVTHRLPGIQ